jgi:hypothetical protein
MNRSSVPRQQQQKHQQQQKLLRIKKQEKTLEFHSRLIEALVAGRPIPFPETPMTTQTAPVSRSSPL